MKLENQVCSLEQARKLRELGVTQNSVWYWVTSQDSDRLILAEQLIALGGTPANRNIFSAFTVAELGEMLKAVALRFPAWCPKPSLGVGVFCWDDPLPRYETSGSAQYEAIARANLLCFLCEYEDIKASWLNR